MRDKPDSKYTPMNFVAKMRELSGPKEINIIYGTQESSLDCFHRGLDWMSELTQGKVDLGIKYEKYPLTDTVNKAKASTLDVCLTK